MIDEQISQSDAAKAIRAIESHDPELLAELAAAHRLKAQETPIEPTAKGTPNEEDYVPPTRMDAAQSHMHPGSEDAWFALNGSKLQAAAFEQLQERERDAQISDSAKMRDAGLNVGGERHGANHSVRGHTPKGHTGHALPGDGAPRLPGH